MSYPQDFSLFWGHNGYFRKEPDEQSDLTLDEAISLVEEIVEYYSQIITTRNDVAEYLYLDLAFGKTEYRGGYLIQKEWAEAAYAAAKVSYPLFEKLRGIVATNTRLGIAIPTILLRFSSEALDGSVPAPRNRGTSSARDQLRNYAIFECLDLLVNQLGMRLQVVEGKNEPSASKVIEAAFSRYDLTISGVPRPRENQIRAVWYNNDRQKLREEIALFHWVCRHQRCNHWFRNFWPKMIETKVINYLCTCFYWLR